MGDIRTFGSSMGSLLITVLIRCLDFLWEQVARRVVMWENHRTKQSQRDALAVKLFWMKLFNWMYPYIYIAFMKEVVAGCGKKGCIPELQKSLAIFFASSAFIDFAFAAWSWWKCAKKIKEEIRRVRSMGNDVSSNEL